jgi:DNA methylase/Recombinase
MDGLARKKAHGGTILNLQPLIDAINDRSVVSGLTHGIYRYPARFSPTFARAAIEMFTKPGDTVYDPFMGGSTSLVEALSLGRNAIGNDLNQLAVFLARVKTLRLSDDEIGMLRDWAELTIPDLSPPKPVVRHTHWQELGYQNNMPWRFRKIAEQALNNAFEILEGDVLLAAGCIVLKTVQWAVDCKKYLPTAADFRVKIVEDTEVVATGLQEFRRQMDALPGKQPTVEFYHSAADSITAIPSKASIHTILKDRAYIGEVHHKGHWYPGKHEPLIDRPTWNRVQALLGGHVHHATTLTYAGQFMRPAAIAVTRSPVSWSRRSGRTAASTNTSTTAALDTRKATTLVFG